MRGRKPYPYEAMAANNDKERLTQSELEARKDSEPKIKSNSLKCPEHLSEDAKVEWRRIVALYEEIDQDVVNDLDCDALEVYCNAKVLYRFAIERITESSAVYVKKGEKTPRRNPWMIIANQQADVIKKYGELLLLNPVSRARMGVAAAKADREPPSPMEMFFRNRPPELRKY